ncbi:glycoside hydrolase family 15 protein [Natronobacterium gregoryi]|uniref:Glycoside hydrolase 15-like protein n=2 Tax=Natronobacterium gregoryi TaxID=44930 RepID=L0AHL2_NATGS|nr:glycoside hydrolase family 15 protein [Natronobacterium gregoryi]AFZ73398.1 glycosyl hydrolase, glucoamylase [Natronobacterium gregoryi SP2]ELY68594.1 glycoside hydrolase 15-like protein [Natronobacterium gregoryi SP2]PLK19676.1 glycoside hydrolase family 15 protein [Natronobacterium gregoryi SP2]SFI73131.1 Glucoamylase (glucan-1,4-alpha-glucosidase), GH15 family [Natronobacterium gregoryi]
MKYPPLRDYGIVGNDDRCALVSRDGSIDWCCFPHLEDESVFARILDVDRGGHFAVSPAAEYESSHRYRDRTNVLETTFETTTGQATITDCMPIRDGDAGGEDFQQAFYRLLECDRGSVDLDLAFAPRFDYARTKPAFDHVEDGVMARGDDESLFLSADGALGDDLEVADADATVTASVSLEAGERCWTGIQYGGREPLASIDLEETLDETTRYWRDWVCETCDAVDSMPERWTEMVVRSQLVLKLLIHHETGAIPAAATTSIPEEIGSDRTWDYRYNWVRDAKFTVQALHDTGHQKEARQYFDWFADIARTEPADIQPLYGLHGEADITERELAHLSGYRDIGPVRIGNGAAPQRQLDAYGTIVQAVYETVQFDESRELSEDEWDAIRDIVDYACKHWEEPDPGIWEFRDEHRHFLHSKLLCWVALDRGIALATENDLEAPLEAWNDDREAIREAIEERGFSERAHSFVQHFETDEAIDATALLLPIYEFLPADDDRVQATIDTVIDRLTTDDGLVLRFVDTDVRRDEAEAFVLCSFWLVDALVLSNRLERAEEYFENVLECASPLGLYSEKIDPEDGQLLGNFPQAFSHLGLINSVTYLARALEHDGDVRPEDFHPDNVETLFRRGDRPEP